VYLEVLAPRSVELRERLGERDVAGREGEARLEPASCRAGRVEDALLEAAELTGRVGASRRILRAGDSPAQDRGEQQPVATPTRFGVERIEHVRTIRVVDERASPDLERFVRPRERTREQPCALGERLGAPRADRALQRELRPQLGRLRVLSASLAFARLDRPVARARPLPSARHCASGRAP
jgi:hypothetical protein